MKFRIAILGIGGVGGYLGGRLAQTFAGSNEVEIIFIARGGHAAAIRANGLRIETLEGEFAAMADLVATDPPKIGVVDLVIVATKAYDLADGIRQYAGIIGPQTSILTLLNGVGHTSAIRAVISGADVWSGCAFIVARLAGPGKVWVGSDIRLFEFGGADALKTGQFLRILESAGVDARLSADIEKTVWEKFVFISPLASLTSFHDKNNGHVIEGHADQLRRMIREVVSLGRARGVRLEDDIVESTLKKLAKAPPGATSSMHSDFKKGGRTEVETLTGYVVREAARSGIDVPEYVRVYDALSRRTASP
jgi:2-dehydropantoate 2-reductase